MFSENIKRIRERRGLGVNELSRLSGVNASYISALERNEKQNPTITTLKKIADTLEVTVDELMKEESSASFSQLSDWDEKHSTVEKESESCSTGEFKTPESAMKFILSQPSIMGFGGFDIKKMTDEEIMEFANELLRQLQLISYKYKK